ncbi:MAG: uracil-DNA glycosylase [Acidobacteria bacterium]|nr:uracil-DNA glycosylase [Acidobacteriota bacterium]
MTDRAREQLRNWLEFYEELGLAPFVRRPPAPFLPRGEERPDSAAVLAAGTGPAPPVAVEPVPRVASVAVAGPAAPQAKKAAATAPILATPALSLFGEAPGRIEGETLPQIRADLGECTRCKLAPHRTRIVFGEGNPKAQLVFVGEAPGADEDAQGRPFVGRAGQLLTKWIEGSLAMKRGDVYICNVLKCRPPGNRSPEKDEVDTCSPFLIRQLDAIRPKLICCLGAVALQELLGKPVSISRLRGQFFDWRGMKMFATFHPAYLLRNPHADPEVQQDLRKIRQFLA